MNLEYICHCGSTRLRKVRLRSTWGQTILKCQRCGRRTAIYRGVFK